MLKNGMRSQAFFHAKRFLKVRLINLWEGIKGQKGTTEVDDAFLAEIEGWREALARNFALRNPSLSTHAS